METKEFEFKGFKMSGFIGLLLVFAMIGVMVWSGVTLTAPAIIIPILFVVLLISTIGFVQLEPNEARAMVFFGKYRGTFRETVSGGSTPSLPRKRYPCAPATSTPRPSRLMTRAVTPL